jgi:AcrR family transcriptional regulator
MFVIVATAKTEETRERNFALSLFRQRGFDETTMRDIGAETGVATAAAYHYFRSSDLLAADRGTSSQTAADDPARRRRVAATHGRLRAACNRTNHP